MSRQGRVYGRKVVMLNALSLLEILKDVSLTAFSPGGCFSIERLFYQDIKSHRGDVKLSNFHNVWFLGCCAASNLEFIIDIHCLLVHDLCHHIHFYPKPVLAFGYCRSLGRHSPAVFITIWYYTDLGSRGYFSIQRRSCYIRVLSMSHSIGLSCIICISD